MSANTHKKESKILTTLPLEIILQFYSDSNLDWKDRFNLVLTCKKNKQIIEAHGRHISIRMTNPSVNIVLSELPIEVFRLAHKYDLEFFCDPPFADDLPDLVHYSGVNLPKGHLKDLSTIGYLFNIHKIYSSILRVKRICDEKQPGYFQESEAWLRTLSTWYRDDLVPPSKKSRFQRDLQKLYPGQEPYDLSHSQKISHPLINVIYYDILEHMRNNNIWKTNLFRFYSITPESIHMLLCLMHPANTLKLIERGVYDQDIFQKFARGYHYIQSHWVQEYNRWNLGGLISDEERYEPIKKNIYISLTYG